ncbi:MAG: VWA domain-containing protein [Prevotellaceae bacterium]|jgi:hypothetical protein|nr:VWA domain-containing protein [Prevotellaceae bacterium]
MDREEQDRRAAHWRLILGPDSKAFADTVLTDEQSIMDAALAAIYDSGEYGDVNKAKQGAAVNSRAIPNLAKWLTDIRTFFPQDTVSIIQSDAIERKGLTQLLLEPETLRNIKPDISMLETLIVLKGQIPEKSKATARELVRSVVNEIMKRMETDLRKAVAGALNKKAHSPISNFASIDWKQTINRNLKNYDLKGQRLIPEKFYFFERSRKQKDRTIIINIDQSGSMCDSIIYSSIMGSIFASMPALDTHVVAFNSEITDLTEMCHNDPVDMLFGIQLGGSTDINKSVSYCQTLIENPTKTIFILISDLYEGGVKSGLLRRLSEMHKDGVKIITLLSLSNRGKPDYDADLAKEISKLGIACFACSPDRLPELMEAAIKGMDLKRFDHK